MIVFLEKKKNDHTTYCDEYRQMYFQYGWHSIYEYKTKRSLEFPVADKLSRYGEVCRRFSLAHRGDGMAVMEFPYFYNIYYICF